MAKSWLVGPAALLLIGAAPQNDVAKLGWLGGAWLSETPEGWTEEIWTVPRGGLMLGTNRSGKGERATGFEFMRIALDGEGRVAFFASPNGKPASAFPMVSSAPGEAVFENPAHDYPTRIVYRRDGDVLTGTISGPGGKNVMRWVFRRR